MLEAGLLSVVELALAGEEDHALAFLQTLVEESLEYCSVWVCLLPKTLLDSIFPLSFVVPLAIWSVVLSVAMRLIDVPFTLIIATVFVDHDSEALSSVLDPVTDVVQSLRLVDHDAQAMPSLALLANVHPFLWKFCEVVPGYLGIVVRVGERAEGVFSFWI